MSNPVIYYLKWVVSETVGGFNAGEAGMKQIRNSYQNYGCCLVSTKYLKFYENMAGLMNEDYTDGIICPYEIPDQWQYEYDRQW